MGLFYRICKSGLQWGLLAAWILAFSTGCAGPPASKATLSPTGAATAFQAADTPSIDLVWQMLEQVDKDRALNDLRQLVGDTPICIDKGCYTIMNRATGSKGLQWAKDYVTQELASLGYSVELRDWSREGRADQNLIARKTGSLLPDQEIYFVAHLDGVKENWGGERFPAADDNASGVVDLLELARVLSDYSLSRTVVLFFSTGEEQGAHGVRSYLDQLSQEEVSSIQYVVNIDMIGYDKNRDGVMELWYGDHEPSFALTKVMSDTIRAYQLDLEPIFVRGCD